MSESRRVHDDVAALVADAVSWMFARLEEAQRAGRTAHVALTGGSLSDSLHEALVRRSGEAGVDWSQVHWWWGDERFVAGDSPDRNAGQAASSLLEPLAIAADRIHRVASSDDVADAETAAERYASELATHAPDGFEIVLLGLGPDGHVASLFPGHDTLQVTDRLAVAEHDSPKPPSERVSLTFPALNHARAVAFVVAGEAKAQAVQSSLTAGPVAECPARGVRGSEETVWFLDRSAGAGVG